MTGTRGIEGFGYEEKIKKMFQNEKNKYKYKIYYLKTFSNKYLNIIHKTTENIFINCDSWITQSVSLQNDALNTVIEKIKEILNDQRLIDEKEDIEPIEMDAFEIEQKNTNEENKDEIIIKPIDDKSVRSNIIYHKLNIDYLINDNYINAKIEDINDIKNIPYDNINEFKEEDFYFDINKLYYIYKNIKRYELEENTISQNIFYQLFIRQIMLNVFNDLNEENKNKENNENNNEKKEETEDIDDEEEENEEKKIKKEEKKKKYLIGICEALRKLSTKQIYKFLNLYKIPKEPNENNALYNIKNNNEDLNKEKNNVETKETEENKINEDIEKNEEEKEKEKENDEELEDEENTNTNNKINKKEEKEEKIKIEYETYLKLKEIFTILSLIGCPILTIEEEGKINKELNDKIIKNGYINKDDFMEYIFWFEKFFEYQNNLNNLINENIEWIVDDHKDKKMNIKQFLFELWKDDTGNNINIKQLLLILKIGNYITDLTNNNNKRYYEIIFN